MMQDFVVDLCPTGDEGATYHIKNAPGGEIQRPHLVDRGSSLVVQGDLVQVLHGTLSPDGAPATLLVVDFNFVSMELSRRFKSAKITLRFADARSRFDQDPEVIRIAPCGYFSIHPTQKREEVKRSVNLSAQAGGAVAGVNTGFGWELTESVERQDQTTLAGTIRLEGRTYGPKDTARWVLMENVTQKSGVPANLRGAILLKRKNFDDQFIATIQIEAEVDLISSTRSLFGRIPKDDPVVFDPNYAPTSEGFDLDNLEGYALETLSGLSILGGVAMSSNAASGRAAMANLEATGMLGLFEPQGDSAESTFQSDDASSSSDAENVSAVLGFDIVAVHGVNGHRTGTWALGADDVRAAEGRTWLETLLPTRIPEARVMTFGYDSGKIPGGLISKAGVRAKALELLEALWGRRDFEHEGDRPIVFLGCDLGGSIIKQALLIANSESQYRPIAAHARCLVFFGTPHRAEDVSSWEDLVFGIAFASWQRPCEGFSGAVREASHSLMQLEEEFYGIAGRYNIVDIYVEDIDKDNESERMLISKCAATLDIPSEDRIACKRDYWTLSKFSEGDGLLDVLCRKIRDVSSGLGKDYLEYLEMLSSLSPKNYLSKQSPRLGGTFEWVLAHKTCQSFLETYKSRILHLYGRRGSGRTLLSHMLFQFLRETTSRDSHSVVYFSFDEHDGSQSSTAKMLSSLLFQLLLSDPSNFGKFANLYVHALGQASLVKEELWVLFRTLLTYPGRKQIICIINAIHECDSSRTEFLKDLVTAREADGNGFKVIFTNALRADIRASLKGDEIRLDESTKLQADITRCVGTSVAHLVERCPRFRNFEKEIVAVVSSGSTIDLFWVDLALKQLESARLRSRPSEVHKFLRSLPPTASDIFEAILDKIPLEDRPWAKKALTWFSYGLRPMKVSEMAVALAIDANNVLVEDRISQDLASDLERAFGPLVKVVGGDVHLIHPYARKVLVRSEEDEGSNKEKLWYHVKHTAHWDLAQSCLAYLSMEGLENAASHIEYGGDGPSLRLPPKNKYNLLVYAAQHWPAHYRLASHMAGSPHSPACVLEFLGNKGRLRMWSGIYWCVGDLTARPRVSFRHPLPIAAQLGLSDVVECMLRDSAGATNTGDRTLALEQAAQNGFVEVVKLLLQPGMYDGASILSALSGACGSGDEDVMMELIDYVAGMKPAVGYPPLLLCRAAQLGRASVVARLLKAGARVDATHVGITPLHFAAEGGHGSVVKLLLGAGADVAAVDPTGSTPLANAAFSGVLRVIEQLIQAKSDVTVIDEQGDMPLHLAALTGSEAAAKLLIDAGADPRAKGGNGDTPLHKAVTNGYKATTGLLLRCEANIDDQNDTGETPLVVAAARQREGVVRLLVLNHAAVDLGDNEGMTALHHAALNRSVGIAELLLKGKANPNVQNSEGLTPLMLASKGGFSPMVDLLLGEGAEVNIQDAKGYAALHRAAGSGSLKIVQALLEKDADVSCSTEKEMTALDFAAEKGHESIVRLLLDSGANASARSGTGWTPLDQAAAKGYVAVVQTLVDRGVDPNAWDENGWTPLHLAAQNGWAEVIDILLDKGADIECQDSEGNWTPLQLARTKAEATELLLKRGADVHAAAYDGGTSLIQAAGRGCAAVVKLLLEAGAHVNAANDSGWTALHGAADSGNEEVVRLLLDYDADVNRETKRGETALRVAASGARDDVLLLLLSKGASIDHRDVDGSRALHAAVATGSESTVRLLLDANADLGTPDDHGNSPLYTAATEEQTAVLELLLERGADINTRGGIFGTVLQRSARYGLESMVRLLLGRGADVNVQDGTDCTALQAAVAKGHETVARLLLQNGADVHAQGGEWGFALHAAVAKCPSIVPDLLNAGAKVYRPDSQGLLAIHHAAWGGNISILKLILSKRNSLSDKDVQGRTVLHHAASGNSASKGHSAAAMVKFILDSSGKKSKYNVPDDDGWTPLHWACRGKNPNVVRLLLRAEGTDPVGRGRDGWTPKRVAEFHGRRPLVPLLEAAAVPKPLSRAPTTDLYYESPISPSKEYELAGEEQTSPCSENPQGRYQNGIYCDGCHFVSQPPTPMKNLPKSGLNCKTNRQDIYGTRYKCRICCNYDYCFKCYRTAAITHKGHEFKEIVLED
ncbi:MAG: hypothetical protein M1839_007706 [Geoglossum umbratile]|nr:MAG: hypothetical protein M1839_007706 [Geoglossum umbratile]